MSTQIQNPAHVSHTLLDENAERAFWQARFDTEPYYARGYDYTDYESAYRAGYLAHERFPGRHFDQIEDALRADWEQAKGDSRLSWDEARYAARAAWHRLERAMPGDADGDGR